MLEPRLTRLLATLAPALLLGACASAGWERASHRAASEAESVPAFAAPAAVVDPALAIDRWWIVFGDAELDRLIESALRRNHDLAIAAARVEEARARLAEVRGAQLPGLELQVDHGRFRRGTEAAPPGTSPLGSSHSVALAGGLEVDVWGGLAAGTESARQRLVASRWQRATVQWSLTAALAETHFTLRAVQRQVEISQAVRDSRARSLGLRQRERAAGATSDLEVHRAEAELAAAESTASTLLRQRAAAEATLGGLSGLAPGEVRPVEPARAALDPMQGFTVRLPSGDAAQWLQRRPDIGEAEAELAATEADVSAARAATLPQLTLSGSIGSDARSLAGLFNGPAFVWSVAASIAQPIFDGGRRRARVEQADARADAAFAHYRRTVLGAVRELREAYAAIDLAARTQQAEHERAVAFEKARAIAETGHAQGALGQLDVLDAERNAFNARLAEVTAYRDRLLGQIAVFKALGGGHDGVPADGTPTPSSGA